MKSRFEVGQKVLILFPDDRKDHIETIAHINYNEVMREFVYQTKELGLYKERWLTEVWSEEKGEKEYEI